MDRIMSATEARVHFGELLDAVCEGADVVFVARGGRPVVAVVAIEEWNRLRGSADPWVASGESMRRHQEFLQTAREAGDLRDFDVEAAIREGREERDEQLVDRVR